MFTYVHLQNFKSFDDITFDLTDRYGNPKKMILIFGENGIGKSNLASAFFMLAETLRTMDVRDLMQSLLAEKPDNISDEDLSRLVRIHYRDTEALIKDSKMVASDEPMMLEFGFILEGKKGRYILETDNSQIIHERLEYVLVKNKGVCFDITPEKASISTKIFKSRAAYNEIKTSCVKFWGKHTLLAILMHESFDKANTFIREQLNDNIETVLKFISHMSCKVKFGSAQERSGISLPRGIFSNFMEGSVSVGEEDLLDNAERMLNLFFRRTYRDIKNVYYRRKAEDQNIKYQLILTKIIAGKERDIEFERESTGTQSLLELLPFMLVSVYGASTVIDEFDTAIHDLLVEELAYSLYNDHLSEHFTGQLIMTTHNTRLMETEIPPECIYVLSENKDGRKSIECILHYDPKIHENTNVRKQYLGGKYQGIPAASTINFASLLEALGFEYHKSESPQ